MANQITATAHTNIALIKYWGKRDVALNLPTTSSLSLTLDKFYTTTTVRFEHSKASDELILNGASADSARIHSFLELFRGQFGDFPAVAVTSENHVPTAAGLASSASSFAALAAAMNGLLSLDLGLTDLSRLARRGSGSASRSLFGNFAEWHAGTDDASSFAESFYDDDIGLTMIAAHVSGSEKKISSTLGMQRAQTSPLYGKWVEHSARQLTDMKRAIVSADSEQIGLIAQENALSMHALNRSCSTPFDYFTDETRALIAFVESCYKSGLLAFVTLDAGPNVKIITNAQDAQKLLKKCQENFPELAFDVCRAGGGVQID
ncbi:MAG: diphosphomevalonate decarboxylase [Streptococcaceae bacterium]|jgi:diphosphomevalonate decarboxylase|nr:diphosphomevalonate decarboxylase [Streptococcaceae bacterium]